MTQYHITSGTPKKGFSILDEHDTLIGSFQSVGWGHLGGKGEIRGNRIELTKNNFWYTRFAVHRNGILMGELKFSWRGYQLWTHSLGREEHKYTIRSKGFTDYRIVVEDADKNEIIAFKTRLWSLSLNKYRNWDVQVLQPVHGLVFQEGDLLVIGAVVGTMLLQAQTSNAS